MIWEDEEGMDIYEEQIELTIDWGWTHLAWWKKSTAKIYFYHNFL